MKKKLASLVALTFILASISYMPLAAESDSGCSLQSADEISRETYISFMANEKGISYEEAERLDDEQNRIIERAQDEVIRYVTLEKSAGGIYDGAGYSKTVNLAVYAKYLYNLGLNKPVELLEVSAPYAYISGISMDRITFDHGDYDITRNSTTKSTVTVIGSFTYTEPGVSVGVGGNIVSVSTTVGDCTITTEAITLSAVFTILDCA